jgi:hypothetical protein
MNLQPCPICNRNAKEHTEEEVKDCLLQTYHKEHIPFGLNSAIGYAYGTNDLKGSSQNIGTGSWHLTFRDESIDTKEPYLDILRKILLFAKPLKKHKITLKDAQESEVRLRTSQRTLVEGDLSEQDGPFTEMAKEMEDLAAFHATLPVSEDMIE